MTQKPAAKNEPQPSAGKQPFELAPLPFGMDALSPHISSQTLEYHHGKHHRAYVNKLNELVQGTKFAAMGLEDIVRQSTGPMFNNAAQVWNHDFYWKCLGAEVGGRPEGALAAAIDAYFGSFEEFAGRFKASATSKFGSGWTWLVKAADGTLAIRNGDDADNPLRWEQVPLLTCDVWEHAYYIDYRNQRPAYVEAFWHHVNWGFVARNFAAA
jgi:Fe-Mn family superoxide dismutase